MKEIINETLILPKITIEAIAPDGEDFILKAKMDFYELGKLTDLVGMQNLINKLQAMEYDRKDFKVTPT
jgi:hypothetical protein